LGPATAADKLPSAELGEEDDVAQGIQRSQWTFQELASDEAWKAEFKLAGEATQLLSAEDGRPLVYRLTSDRFGDGQILIAANGAPFLNGSLVEPLHREVATRLIEQCLPAKRVAFLAYDETGILISRAKDADSRSAGLELLMVWPLSAITMPAALLGVLICIAFFPILGRPQRNRRRSVSDFGLHVSALGRMLLEARDIGFAQQAIADYFRQVRDEPPPPWLETIQDARTQQGPPQPPSLQLPAQGQVQGQAQTRETTTVEQSTGTSKEPDS
jgi:hypothetical protein